MCKSLVCVFGCAELLDFVMNIIADVLTFMRGVFVFGILLLSMQQGIRALPTIVVLTILCWFSDILDGTLARKSDQPTHLGPFDLLVDVGLAIVIAVILVVFGMIPLLLVILISMITLLFGWLFHSSAPRKLAMGLSYGAFLLFVCQNDTEWFLFMIGSMFLFVLFFPDRTREQIGDFLGEAANLLHRGQAVNSYDKIDQK